jgi:hypothetical protein
MTLVLESAEMVLTWEGGGAGGRLRCWKSKLPGAMREFAMARDSRARALAAEEMLLTAGGCEELWVELFLVEVGWSI